MPTDQAATGRATPPPASPGGGPTDTALRAAIILLGGAAAVVIATHSALQELLPPGPRLAHGLWRYLAVATLGGVVGFAELVSRYRDEPLLATRSPPGMFYILFNAAVAMLALWMLEHYRHQLNPPDDGYSRVIVAGFGSMLILRSKLLTFRQPSGTEVAVGPAFIVDTMVAAINRAVDRWRAQARFIRVSRLSRDFAAQSFRVVEPRLSSALLAFQNMEPETLVQVRTNLENLAIDTKLDDRTKFARAGYDILTACGEAVFDQIFDDLRGVFLTASK